MRHMMLCSDVTIRVLIRELPLFEIGQGKRVVVSGERTLLSLIERVTTLNKEPGRWGEDEGNSGPFHADGEEETRTLSGQHSS